MTGRLVDYRRVFVTITVAGDKLRLTGSLNAPMVGSGGLALVSRGVLPGGDVTLDLPLTTLQGAPGKDGADGLSAYQLARAAGYGGTQTQWLASLVGAAGDDAYQVARTNGYGGTRTQWLASLVGAPGKDGTNGTNGTNGKDASAVLGSVALSETATVAIQAGTRRRTITVSSSLGLVAGDVIDLHPKSPTPSGYDVRRAWATASTQITVDLTVPLIAIGGSYSIDCWLLRLRTA